MEYKKISGRFYLRIDKNEDVLQTVLSVCQ